MTSSETAEPAWKPKKTTLGLLLLLALLPLVTFLALRLSRPDMPEAWQELHLGMSRAEVVALAGGSFEPDGADPELELERVVHRDEAWFGECAWILKARFGEDDRLQEGETVFVSKRVGMITSERPIRPAPAPAP